jgi:quinohemoprotein amine dehydrogenase beta subunit
MLKTIITGAALATLIVAPAAAKEYLLTGVKPDQLVLVDLESRQVERSYTIPDAGTGVLTLVPSPDGKVAYAIVNRWESVAGIDLDSGEQVFRADLSQDDIRAKATFGMDISPDGKELYVFVLPTRIGSSEYQVQDTHVAVFDTAAGLDAEPIRTFPAPRRTAILAASADGSRLYSVNWDITALDPRTGEVLDVHPVRHWERPNYGEPDVLGVWPQWEQTGVYSNPYFVVRTDMDPEDPAAYKTGLFALDLNDHSFRYTDFENTEVVIFSSVIDPTNPDLAFAVYTQLSKIDLAEGRLLDRVDLDHTYYAVNISGDGRELYVGGTMDDIGVYDAETLEKLDSIRLPGGNDMALSSLRIIQR